MPALDLPEAQDRPRLAWCCGYTPEEIIEAAGLTPYRLALLPHRPRSAAAWLPPDFCSYARSLAEAALSEEGYHRAGVIIVNSCQAMLHLYNFWRRARPGDFVYLLHVPRQGGEEAVTYYAEGLRRLWQAITAHFRVRASEADLIETIGVYARVRSLVERLRRLRRRRPAPLTGAQAAEIMALAARSAKRDFALWLADQLPFWEEAAGKGRAVAGSPLPGLGDAPASPEEEIRCVVTGSAAPPEFMAALEGQGVTVVADDLCTCGRYLEPGGMPEPGAAFDPFLFLAWHYLNRSPCPRMVEGDRRWRRLVELVEEYRAGGVIYFGLKFCDYHHYAFPLVRSRLQAAGMPCLRLEGEYCSNDTGQMGTRVQAFVEALGSRRG
ncbi:MAG: 2-hydroxyacyl-CoA dehydratase family protein [Clostridia bacterium]|jgi:benzoyl-CoA reductase/2-hydroxyglutaryl-CoA dehydratase subunit BcrC/BadD/HgdB|nr:2-hydroxyacyl-CoA dehydratase family protein [Clostridia bacterium]MDH7572137.1 2-hydroxyacyl-CoA dehydratase family protein [Clostridia bacterium]